MAVAASLYAIMSRVPWNDYNSPKLNVYRKLWIVCEEIVLETVELNIWSGKKQTLREQEYNWLKQVGKMDDNLIWLSLGLLKLAYFYKPIGRRKYITIRYQRNYGGIH